MRVTQLILQHHQPPSGLCSVKAALLLALPGLSAMPGRVTAQKPSQPAGAAQSQPNHSPDSARTREAKTQRGRTQKPPGHQGSLHAPESQTLGHSPSPSLTHCLFILLAPRTNPHPLCFAWIQATPLTINKVWTDKACSPSYTDLPLQGPADRLLPGCPHVGPRTLVGQLSGCVAQQHPVAFCS